MNSLCTGFTLLPLPETPEMPFLDAFPWMVFLDVFLTPVKGLFRDRKNSATIHNVGMVRTKVRTPYARARKRWRSFEYFIDR